MNGFHISSLYLQSPSSAPALRIGLLVDSFELDAAFRRVIEDIRDCSFANVELVVVNDTPVQKPPPATGALDRLMRRTRALADPVYRRRLLYSAYLKFDARHTSDPNPLANVDCSDILGEVPRLHVVPITKKFVHRFPPEALAAIRDCNLDVLLRFGFNILRGDILVSARYGVWSFHHGDNDHYRGGPPMFWEVVEDHPLSGVILQRLTEKLDDGVVLCKSLFATALGLSCNRNIPGPYWGSTHFVIRKLHELHCRGWESLEQNAIPGRPYQGRKEIYRAPTNLEVVKWVVPRVARRAAALPIQRQSPGWRIRLRRGSPPLLTADAAAPWENIDGPKGHDYKNPFLLAHQGRTWLFFEDYVQAQKRGRICCAPLSGDLSMGEVSVCLDLPYHVSYPHVFTEEGQVYMIPESKANQSVELWRAAEFPRSWVLERTLFRGKAVNTTSVCHEDGWYFFTALAGAQEPPAFCALFYSAALTGGWRVHPATPVCTDVREARPGGAIHELQGRLFRPVQDWSGSNGLRLPVKEIVELTPTSCREKHVRTMDAMHTYAVCGDVEAYDCVAH